MNEQQEERFVYGRDLVFLSMGVKEAFESGTIAMRIKEGEAISFLFSQVCIEHRLLPTSLSVQEMHARMPYL